MFCSKRKYTDSHFLSCKPHNHHCKTSYLFSVIVASLGTCDPFTIRFIVALLQDMLSFHHWIGTELKKQLTHSLSVRDLK